MDNMVYCRKCGKQIYEADTFCPHCGAQQKVANMNANTDVPSNFNMSGNININSNLGGISQRRLLAILFAILLDRYSCNCWYY